MKHPTGSTPLFARVEEVTELNLPTKPYVHENALSYSRMPEWLDKLMNKENTIEVLAFLGCVLILSFIILLFEIWRHS